MARRGFTLIEVLMAVFVMMFMTMLLYGTVRTLFAAERDLDDVVETQHMARVTLDRLTRDLSHAFLSLNFGLNETTRTVFLGERDRLVFCYVGNVPVRAGALETDQGVVEYRLGGTSDRRGGRKLIRRFKPIIDDDPESGGEEAVVATGIKSLRFEYWDREREDWDSDWKADDPTSQHEPGFQLPPRVRIRLEMEDRAGQTHAFETQTSIYMTRPLLFGQPANPKAMEWLVNDRAKRLEDQLKSGIPPLGAPGIPGVQPSPGVGTAPLGGVR